MSRDAGMEVELPPGFELIEGARGVLACHRDYRSLLESSGYGPDAGEPPPSDVSGRSPLGELILEGDNFLVRRFRHGGLLRWATGARYASPARPFRELLLSERLREHGIATPRVIAARARRPDPMGWRLELVSRRLERVRDLAEVLEAMRTKDVSEEERRGLFRAVGELVGRMHAVGFLHADLHPRNLLLEEGGSGLWVIDLEGSSFSELDAVRMRSNLRRLYRSVRKREERGAPFSRRADYLRFLRGYTSVGGESAGPWKELWRAIVAEDRARAGWHRMGWLLERWFAGGPEARDGKARVRG